MGLVSDLYILDDPDSILNGIPIACKGKRITTKIGNWPSSTQELGSFNNTKSCMGFSGNVLGLGMLYVYTNIDVKSEFVPILFPRILISFSFMWNELLGSSLFFFSFLFNSIRERGAMLILVTAPFHTSVSLLN